MTADPSIVEIIAGILHDRNCPDGPQCRESATTRSRWYLDGEAIVTGLGSLILPLGGTETLERLAYRERQGGERGWTDVCKIRTVIDWPDGSRWEGAWRDEPAV